ncbi:MAG: hypothetical protein Q4F69_05395 [Bacteroidia bacterium]|nr:hypothetical protein [Bacteroidia bacterium]
MTGSEQQTLAALYKRYNVVIKPLIAEIEARSEKMPLPLFNEIRAFNDHVAHCYLENADSKMVGDELEKAGRHHSFMGAFCASVCLGVNMAVLRYATFFVLAVSCLYVQRHKPYFRPALFGIDIQ